MRVVIAPVGATADDVLDCLTAWSRSALLEPFCWWPVPSDGSVTLEVVRIERGERRLEMLADALGDAELGDVALVAFLPATAGEVLSTAFVDGADACLAKAHQVLAFSLDAASECAMIVAPADVGQPVARELFSAQWAANIYVAPEDRTDPSDFNHLAGNAAAFPRHAAHALASIADLWVGGSRAAASVLETLTERQPNLAPAPIQVVRCFSRVLDYGYVVDHVAAGVFREEVQWPNPDHRTLDRIADPGEVLPDVALSFLAKHADVLGCSAFEPLTLDPPERLGLLEALRRFIKLVIQRIRNKPFEILEHQIARLHDAAAARIEKYSGGSLLVRRYQDSPGGQRGLLHMKACIDQPLYVPDGAVDKAWTELRRLTVGLVDGGELPTAIADNILDRGGLRALVTVPGRISPHPGDKPTATEDYPDPRACDPLRFIEERAAAEAAEDSGEATAEPGPEAPAFEDAIASQSLPPGIDDDGDTSFLGLVGTGIAEALLQARREAAADLEPSDAQKEAWRVAEAKRRSARRGLAFKALFATIAAGGLTYLAWTELDLVYRVPGLVLVFVVWLLVSAFLARSLLQLNQAGERELAQRQLDQLNGMMLKAQRAGDVVRLERRYEEFLDWAEILGWLVHRPWMAEPLDRIDAYGALEPDTMPAALQIGVTLQSDKHLAQLIGRGRSKMFIPGWLGSLYQAVEGLAMDDVALERAIALDGGGLDRPDPAADLSEDPDSPRRKLLEAVIRGDGRHLDDNPLSQDLLGMIDSMGLDGVALGVHIAKSGDANVPRALPAAVRWFDAPDDLEDIAAPLRPAVVAVRGDEADWIGAVVDGRIVTANVTLGANGNGAAHGVRVDVGGGPSRAMCAAAIADGLVLLEGAAPQGADVEPHSEAEGDAVDELDAAPGKPNGDAAAEEDVTVTLKPKPPEPSIEDEDSDATAGPRDDVETPADEPLPDGFVLSTSELAVGEAVLGIGLDSTTWGLVTAAPQGRPARVTFSAAAGPAGTPIVDLDGRLVGLQGAPPPRRRGFIAPTDEADLVGVDVVRRLLAGAPVQEPGEEQPERATRRGAPAARPTPTQFLAEPYQQAAGMALLPQHWTDNRDGHLIEEVTPEPPDLSPASAHIGTLSTGARFHEPLRVLVHRVDLTHPVAADQLRSCRTDQPG